MSFDIKKQLICLNHSGFLIKTKALTIAIDPFKIPATIKTKADLICITHSHFDHFSPDDIEKIRTSKTLFIAPPGVLDPNKYPLFQEAKIGHIIEYHGITIEPTAAYNTVMQRSKYHPKTEHWVGYIFTVDGTRIYHAGDTDFIDEMKDLKNIDIALLPMGGTYTMTMEEAIDAAKAIQAKVVIPIHYKMILGDEAAKSLEKELMKVLPQTLIPD